MQIFSLRPVRLQFAFYSDSIICKTPTNYEQKRRKFVTDSVTLTKTTVFIGMEVIDYENSSELPDVIIL